MITSHDERRARECRAAPQELPANGAVRKKADISVSDEEFEAHWKSANAAGVKVEDVKRSGRADDLRRELEENKVFELLGEKANVTEEKCSAVNDDKEQYVSDTHGYRADGTRRAFLDIYSRLLKDRIIFVCPHKRSNCQPDHSTNVSFWPEDPKKDIAFT